MLSAALLSGCAPLVGCTTNQSFGSYEQYIQDYYDHVPLDEIQTLVYHFVPDARTKYTDLIRLSQVNSVILQSSDASQLIYNVSLELIFQNEPQLNFQFTVSINKSDYLISYPSHKSVRVPGKGKDLAWGNYLEKNGFEVMQAWLNYYYNGTPLIHHVVWKKEYYYKKLVQLTPGPLVHNYIYATMELFFAIKPDHESSDFYYDSFQLTTFVTNSATLNYPAYIPSLIETST